MSEHSGIEWTDATWNPTTGCTKVSPACAHCYIERTPPFRMQGRRFVKGQIPIQLHENRLTQPLRWKKPKRIFVNSLSDLFHHDVPDAFIDRVFAVMALAPQHTFQVLTKRPERMRLYLCRLDRAPGVNVVLPDPVAMPTTWYADVIINRERSWPLPNVWLGVSVENQHFADERIPLLLETPAAVRFISAEPLLRPINLWRYLTAVPGGGVDPWTTMLDWVIAGGESGPRVRPSDPAWFQSLRDQCVAARVPFFFKQWGGQRPKSNGRLLDGREWNDLPERRVEPSRASL